MKQLMNIGGKFIENTPTVSAIHATLEDIEHAAAQHGTQTTAVVGKDDMMMTLTPPAPIHAQLTALVYMVTSVAHQTDTDPHTLLKLIGELIDETDN